MVAPIRNPHLALLRVYGHAHGMIDAGFVAANDSDGRDVTVGISVKNADRTIAIVRDDDGVVNGIIGHAHRPIQSRLGSLKCSQRFDIAFGARGINRNGGWAKLTCLSWGVLVQRGVTPATRILDHSP